MAFVVVLALGAAGCGDDRESGSNGGGAAAESAATGPAPGGDRGEQAGGDDEGGGDRERDGGSGGDSDASAPPQPAEPGDRYVPAERDRKIQGDGSIERFGAQAPDDEADDIVAVAVGYYDARAERDWARACGLMSSSMKQQFAQLAERAESIDGEDCPAVMEAFTARVPREALVREAREVRFNEVRVEGNRAFAIFKSKSIPNGTLPMVRENGRWKVASMVGTTL
jgi:hypothetical protein